MIKKKVVYCEIEFLNEFLSSFPLLQPNDESLRLVDAWMSFYNFFCKSDIVLNISESEFISMTNGNQWLYRLWKKSADSQCGLNFEKETFPDLSSLSGENADKSILNAVFLTTKDDEECDKISKNLGVFVVNPNIANHCNHLFCDSGTAFPDERAKDWTFIKGLTGVKPSININNSMVIIDNYLLCDDKDIDYQKKLELNLKPILQNILPFKLSEGEYYDITVFVGAGSGESHLYDTQYDYLKTMIELIRKELKFRLSVFIGKADDKFHDRSIATNNVLINSGHGFGILRKGGKTNTPTSVNIVFPFFQTKIAWCDNSYLNIMHTAQKVFNRLHEPNINCWGDSENENRLIAYYNKSSNLDKEHKEIETSPIDSSSLSVKVVGKIDLSAIKDYSYRNRYR